MLPSGCWLIGLFSGPLQTNHHTCPCNHCAHGMSCSINIYWILTEWISSIHVDDILVNTCNSSIMIYNYTHQVHTCTLWIFQYILVYGFWSLKINNITVQLFPVLTALLPFMIQFQLSVAFLMDSIISYLTLEVYNLNCAYLYWIRALEQNSRYFGNDFFSYEFIKNSFYYFDGQFTKTAS